MPSGDGALQDTMTGLIHLIGKLKEHRKTIVNSMGAYYWLGGGLETGAPPAEEKRRARGAMIPEYAVRELINIHEGVGWGGSGGWEWVEEGRGGVAVVSCRRGYIHRVYIHRAYIHRAYIHKSCRFKCPRC